VKNIYEGMWIRYGGPSLKSPKAKERKKGSQKHKVSVQFKTAEEKGGGKERINKSTRSG